MAAGGETVAPERAWAARVAAYTAANDAAGARALARSARASAGATEGLKARMGVAAARASLAMGDTAGARQDLRQALSDAPGAGAAVDAARLLTSLERLTTADRLAVGTVYDRHGNKARAADGYRAWLAADAGTPAERRDVRLRMGRALFAAGRYAEVDAAMAPLASAGGDVAAEAAFWTGRAQFRRGLTTRARETWLAAAQAHPGAPAAGDGLFLAADQAHDAGRTADARALYRRVANDFPRSNRAGLSVMRLIGMDMLARDHAGALRWAEDYRRRWPQGANWLQATYWAGRAKAAQGDAAGARALWREVRQREAISYYSVLAAKRADEPFWPFALAAAPADDPSSREARVRGLRAVDVLRAAGHHAEAEAEAERLLREAGEDPARAYPVAEALAERGYAHLGIRWGIAARGRGVAYDARLLRILYPFPFREMVAAEARERRLDPFLVAALTRQESSFKPRIASPVGARGLMQVMPETGRGLARAAGIEGWDAELLYQPEINVHLGTRFLADQMRRYDGRLPDVFSAYNAGPGRAERWKQLPEHGDDELFTERIPFDETREYVKILTRNLTLYRALYAR